MAGVSPDSLLSGTLASYGASAVARVCVECLIGKQKKPILFKVTEEFHTVQNSSRAACAQCVLSV